MKCFVQQKDGTWLKEDREPICNDFCKCGDCLKCLGYTRCVLTANHKHIWKIKYER